jgi:hypothetical protein
MKVYLLIHEYHTTGYQEVIGVYKHKEVADERCGRLEKKASYHEEYLVCELEVDETQFSEYQI